MWGILRGCGTSLPSREQQKDRCRCRRLSSTSDTILCIILHSHVEVGLRITFPDNRPKEEPSPSPLELVPWNSTLTWRRG